MTTQNIIDAWDSGIEPYTTRHNAVTHRKWDDPVYWKGVRIGQCEHCKRNDKDVTRDGLCWVCEGELKPHRHFPTA